MKKTIILLLLILGAVSMNAEDYQYLTFVDNSGTAKSYTALGLEITFSGGNAVVTNGTESGTYSLDNLNRMFFSNDKDVANAIQAITADTAAMHIYTTSGVFVGEYRDTSSLSGMLPQGIYIIKQNGKTRKISVR